MTDSPLTVTDARGKRFKLTGHFRRAEKGEWVLAPHDWTSEGAMRAEIVQWIFDNPSENRLLIFEPLPQETVFDVTVTLSPEDFEFFDRASASGEEGSGFAAKALIAAIRDRKFSERSL